MWSCRKRAAGVLWGCTDEDGEWTGDAMDRKDLERSKQFPHLSAAFRTNVEQFGPNDFFVMQKCMKEASGRPFINLIP